MDKAHIKVNSVIILSALNLLQVIWFEGDFLRVISKLNLKCSPIFIVKVHHSNDHPAIIKTHQG